MVFFTRHSFIYLFPGRQPVLRLRVRCWGSYGPSHYRTFTLLELTMVSAPNTTRISRERIWPGRGIKEGFSEDILRSEGWVNVRWGEEERCIWGKRKSFVEALGEVDLANRRCWKKSSEVGAEREEGTQCERRRGRRSGSEFCWTCWTTLKSVICILKPMGSLQRGFKRDRIRFAFQKEHFGRFVKKRLEGSELLAAHWFQGYFSNPRMEMKPSCARMVPVPGRWS